MRTLRIKITGLWGILSAFFLVIGASMLTCPLSEGKESGDTKPEVLEGIVASQNNRQWRYAFDIARRETHIILYIGVNLIPVEGATYHDIKGKKNEWEQAIEDIWSSKFGMQSEDGEIYPIVVDVNFNGPEFHHEVLVSKRQGRIDELHWQLDDSPRVVAHEFGHMLGCFDEYPGGALAKDKFAGVHESSIMFDPFGAGKVYPHHFYLVQTWLGSQENADLNEIRLMPLERL